MHDGIHAAHRVLALWLDSADPELIEDMLTAGELPALAGLRARGSYGRLRHAAFSGAETVWGAVLTGQPPERTGTWLVADFDPQTYRCDDSALIGYRSTPTIIARGDGRRVVAFDVPFAEIPPGLDGSQVVAWGARASRLAPRSHPPGLLAALEREIGRHPTGRNQDYAFLDDADAMRDLLRRTIEGLPVRARATRWLMARERWDLFLTTFSELHNAGHAFWPHPRLAAALAAVGGAAAIRAVYRAVDAAIGEIVAAAPADARIVVFSPEGMRPNTSDLGGMVFLPELLFRYSFPGAIGLDLGAPAPPTDHRDWVSAIWRHHRAPSRWSRFCERRLPLAWRVALRRALRLDLPLVAPHLAHFWPYQAVNWYQPYWRFMTAFALSTNSDGVIRLNVRGRDGNGVVAPGRFAAVCDDIVAMLHALRDGDTGRPAVVKVHRIRAAPMDGGNPADLIVEWSGDLGNRVVSPRFGALGPVPYLRAGAHSEHGFLCAAGPGIAAGEALADGGTLDIHPTLLSLLGADHAHLPGRCLIAATRAMQRAEMERVTS